MVSPKLFFHFVLQRIDEQDESKHTPAAANDPKNGNRPFHRVVLARNKKASLSLAGSLGQPLSKSPDKGLLPNWPTGYSSKQSILSRNYVSDSPSIRRPSSVTLCCWPAAGNCSTSVVIKGSGTISFMSTSQNRLSRASTEKKKNTALFYRNSG